MLTGAGNMQPHQFGPCDPTTTKKNSVGQTLRTNLPPHVIVILLEYVLGEKWLLRRVYDKIQYGDNTTAKSTKICEKNSKKLPKIIKLSKNHIILVLYQWGYL